MRKFAPYCSLSLSFNFCPTSEIPGEIGLKRLTADTASLAAWPRGQASQGRARAQCWRVSSRNERRNIKAEEMTRLNSSLQAKAETSSCFAALRGPEVKIHGANMGCGMRVEGFYTRRCFKIQGSQLP